MLEDKDIQKMKEVFPTKEDLKQAFSEHIVKEMEVFPIKEEVTTKGDFEELRKDFARVETAVDAYAKKADAYFQEMVILTHKVDRLEKWIHQIAKKVGIELEA